MTSDREEDRWLWKMCDINMVIFFQRKTKHVYRSVSDQTETESCVDCSVNTVICHFCICVTHLEHTEVSGVFGERNMRQLLLMLCKFNLQMHTHHL